MNTGKYIQNIVKISQKLTAGIHALDLTLLFNIYFIFIKHLDYKSTELFKVFSSNYEILYIGVGFIMFTLIYKSFIVPIISETFIIPMVAFLRKYHPNKVKLQLESLKRNYLKQKDFEHVMPYHSALMSLVTTFLIDFSCDGGAWSYIMKKSSFPIVVAVLTIIFGQVLFVVIFFDYNSPKEIENISQLSKSRKIYKI